MDLPSTIYTSGYNAGTRRAAYGLSANLGHSDNTGTSQPVDDSAEQSPTRDKVTLSRQGKETAAISNSTTKVSGSSSNTNGAELDLQKLEQLQQLKHRDTEVRAHEQAHLSAAGRYATSGASFTYQRGPDGASYAIGGEVGIDLGEETTPEATIVKMQTIQRAALAPADPSGADKRIAAEANAKESKARQELVQVEQEALLTGEASKPAQTVSRGTKMNNGQQFAGSLHSNVAAKLAVYHKMAAS